MFLSLLTFLAISSNEPTPLMTEKIEVQVGEDIISTFDIDIVVEGLKAEAAARNLSKSDESSLRKKATEFLIDQKLMAAYLNQLNFGVTERDVDQRINSIRSSSGSQSFEDFKAMLKAQGMSFDRFRMQVKQQMERMQFMGLMKRMASKTIENQDLKAYYQNNAETFKNDVEIELAECLLPLEGDAKIIEEKAEYFVKNPTKFDSCVKNLSKSPSASHSGAIGSFKRGVLPDSIEQKVFSAKAGQVVLIALPRGFQLLKIRTVKNNGPRSFEQVKDHIREQLENSAVEAEMQKTLSDLRTKTFILVKSRT